MCKVQKQKLISRKFVLVLAVCSPFYGTGFAQQEPSDASVTDGQDAEDIDPRAEKAYGGWSLNLDNDLLSGGGRDRDYTGGLALSFAGENTRNWLFSLDSVREFITRITRFDRLYKDQDSISRHSQEFGFTLFTPNDISVAEPIQDDHPYASLFFVSNAAQFILPDRKLSFQSNLTFGLLGLSLADSIQGGIHSVIGSDEPQGWDNQISEGGELTARYSLGVQKTLIEGLGPGFNTQFAINTEASVGFTTDASVGLGMRWGRLERPWYTFNPHLAEYISVGPPPNGRIASTGRREMFLYAGVNLKYRFYNAILQGQFRDSVVSFDRDELDPVIFEGWVGFITEVLSGYRFGLFLRGRTAEIESALATDPVWGGFIISRSF